MGWGADVISLDHLIAYGEALGCTHVSLNTMGASLETRAAHLEAARRFVEAMGR